MDVLPKRLGRYGLTLHADKTRVLPFGRPPRRQQGSRPGLIRLHWGSRCIGDRALQRSLGHVVYPHGPRTRFAASDYCRRRLVSSPSTPAGGRATRRAHETHARGTSYYFGVSGNARSLGLLVDATERIQGVIERCFSSIRRICCSSCREWAVALGELPHQVSLPHLLEGALLHESSVRLRGTQTRLEG